MQVKIKLEKNGKAPIFKRNGDACLDGFANLADDSISIPKGGRCLISLGFAVELPQGYEMIIRPRSGLSMQGIDIAIGTVDENYRGIVKACVINNSNGSYEIKNGDRIAQCAIRKTEQIELLEVEELSETNRGENGFGSSGR